METLVDQIDHRLPGLVRDCRYAETSHARTMLRRAGDLVEWNDGAIRETLDCDGASDHMLARALAWCAARSQRLTCTACCKRLTARDSARVRAELICSPDYYRQNPRQAKQIQTCSPLCAEYWAR